MDPTTLAVVVPQMVVVIALVINAYVAHRRRSDERRWDVEDRATLARKVEITREELARKVETTREDLATKVETTREDLAATVLTTSEALTAHVTQATDDLAVKVEEAKTAAHDAYKEANSINLKISNLNTRVAKQQDELDTKQ